MVTLTQDWQIGGSTGIAWRDGSLEIGSTWAGVAVFVAVMLVIALAFAAFAVVVKMIRHGKTPQAEKDRRAYDAAERDVVSTRKRYERARDAYERAERARLPKTPPARLKEMRESLEGARTAMQAAAERRDEIGARIGRSTITEKGWTE